MIDTLYKIHYYGGKSKVHHISGTYNMIGKLRNSYESTFRKLEGSGPFEDLSIDGKITLK
jgi:hypothetical protein